MNDCSDNFEEGSDDWKRCKIDKRNEEYRAGLSEEKRQRWDTEQWHKGYRKEEEAAGFSDVQKIMRNAMTYFGQYVIDIDNLELYANENWTERIDK